MVKRKVIVLSCGDVAAALPRDKAAKMLREWRAEGAKIVRNRVGGWRYTV